MFLKRLFLRLSPQAHCWAIHCIAWAASLVCNATHSFAQNSTVTESKSTALASSTALSTTIQPEWTIAIHGGAGGDLDRWTEAQRQVLAAPAAVVVANHAMGLFQLAALHLKQNQPDLAAAQLAIDSMAGLLDAVGDRLGEDGETLLEALTEAQRAYVVRSSAAGEEPAAG